MAITAAMTSVLAALSGSAIGALAPVLSNYVLQRSATTRDLLNHQLAQRENLYSEFIKEASRLYADAMIHELQDLSDLVALYALVSRIRLLGSQPTFRAAENFVRVIIRHYGDPNLTLEETRATVLSSTADPLELFSLECRKELRHILLKGGLASHTSL